ncbi:helix-turn-helix transcriptional regulator [Pseudomonas sp. F(2018)]|uniref:XRE family transcriptional regulator n=1 Tax=Pseudomonas sp. F(2018) TaxID=2502240 RepID=UPI00273D413E|nr:helix-turn-helix transcriptional regulator [Pseudomonas sp. F(2018)]
MGTRIEALAARVGGKRELANLSGIHETQLYKYIKGANAPSIAVAVALAQAGNESLDWLLLGKVPAAPVQSGDDEDIYAYVPLYDARCSAGSGAWNERSRVLVNLSFTRYSLRKKGLTSTDLACLRVDGDSMTGLLEDGDTVMIDLRRNTLEGEGVYVVMLDDHLYAKRLQRQFDGSVLIISHNKEYQPMTVPKERLAELQIIGRVVWAGGWMV